MIERILTVGGYTLLSRITGFVRDIMLAAILGAGPVADAFFVAFRLPNHFRAIFAEGAFNAAFIPAYARIRTQNGNDAAGIFGDRIFTLLIATQAVLLALALAFTPQAIDLLAPGFSREPHQFELAVSLTRITFPYLLLITLVTLWGGILNALHRFAAAAAAPILLNLAMMATLACSGWFGGAGYAAAWGVLISGVLQALLVGGDTWRAGALTSFRALRLDADVRRFFTALVPATVGSAGTQLALFADTIIASLLATGAISALYYADRIDQLPIGVIGIAVGTVLLPEMTHRIAAGDDAGARSAQNRAIEFALLLAIPCIVAFLVVPDVIMRGLFMRGRFTADDAHAAALTLDGVYGRACSLRSYPQHRRAFPRPRRYVHADESRADRHRGQHRLQDRADGAVGAGRAGAGNRDWRLDQLRAGSVLGRARPSHCVRRDAQIVAGQAFCRRSRDGLGAFICCARRRKHVVVRCQVPQRIRIVGAGVAWRRGLRSARAGAVRTPGLSLLRKRAQSAPAASIDAFEGTSAPPGGADP